MLQHQRASQSETHPERHGDEESEEEDSDAVEEGEDVEGFAVELREGPDEEEASATDGGDRTKRGGERRRKEEKKKGKKRKERTHSNITIATASFKILSPKMIEYSLGST
jgi:hypothetical protein